MFTKKYDQFSTFNKKKSTWWTVKMMIEWIVNYFFFLNVSFENALVIKERKLNYLKKHVLIERNVVLIFNRFI